MSGGRPLMASSRVWLVCSTRGIDLNSASVYGWFMWWKRVEASAVSTIFPAYITPMRRARPATTPRSWVMRIMAMPSSSCSDPKRSRICFCTVTSSAVVGSSAISSLGLQAKAMAMVTRWRIPPDSWWGYSLSRLRGSGMPTCTMSSMARSMASFLDAWRW